MNKRFIVYNKTIEKEQLFKSNSYNVVSIWECDYDESIKKANKIKNNTSANIHTALYDNVFKKLFANS